ncbi:hypothetical protein [Streptomyces griseomycini]|uniref:Uncharacterized protein n=1 Tax=Streptomyces griseomycini TaxID=66895 RepID=A0A7W7PXU2_9ACTN|nr:hypothetical protein [Streptomyces griseomycini]MBB4903307.1 hypothetical protein [Streptomyces griseomycini]GGR43603.1 hypothetical protein GCM10015536_56950 [Streptomyces griseomycini]
MTTTPATSTARKRRHKTRTRHVNHRPPIVVSTLNLNEIDLTPGKEHLVCPDCHTWCPITGIQGTPKLVPHHSDPAGTPNPRRCALGTDRRVVLDVTVGQWRTDLVEALPSIASRRATKVLPKPKTPQVPAPSQIRPTAISAEAARQAFRQHLARCSACKGEALGNNNQPLPCHDGRRLAVTFLRLLRQEPKRRAVREFFARERRRFDRQYAAQAPANRASEWATVLPAVRAADTRRAQLPVGDAPTEGPSVPLTTLRPAR